VAAVGYHVMIICCLYILLDAPSFDVHFTLHNHNEFHRFMPACRSRRDSGSSPRICIFLCPLYVRERKGLGRQRYSCDLSRFHWEAGLLTIPQIDICYDCLEKLLLIIGISSDEILIFFCEGNFP
jgi:hypothetical protein